MWPFAQIQWRLSDAAGEREIRPTRTPTGEHIEIFEVRTNRRALQDHYRHSIGPACGLGEGTCRSLTDLMPNFTKSFLAIVPEFFGMMLL
jgi:hypothetical protein